ncbi:MAG: hypothetical protein Q7V88_10290 [Actinomycetota bacterium]|nr:hypothetical protein [Actinomycetota bacterium]
MKQRNKLFAGLSLAVAGAAIGAGAIVSANAMAASGDDAPPTDVLTMISMSSDGSQPVQCTFSGEEAATIIGDMPLPVPTDDIAKLEANGGPITITNGQPPEGFDGQIITGTGTVISTGTITAAGGEGGIVQIGEGGLPLPELSLPEGMPEPVLISADEAREGTPEECAAMLENAPPAGGQMVSTAVAVSGSATIETADPAKP